MGTGNLHSPDSEAKVRTSVAHGDFEVLDLEIDRACDSCSPEDLCSMYGPSQPSIPLYNFQDLPRFLQSNPFVTKGYRSILPFSYCLKSLFLWSNESINIWSHLGGFFLFLILMLWDCVMFLPTAQATFSDYFVLSLGLICYQFCMLASAGYHVFMCHSERASRRWLALDLAGISVGLLGCYLPAVHLAFYCLSVWRDVYLVMISLLFGCVLYYQTSPVFLSDRWLYKRILLYMFLSAYGIIPVCHWVYLNGGLHTDIVQVFLPKIAVMYALGVCAFIFYVSKFPERMWPGSFDYLGSSHQWWHVIILGCFFWWHRSGQELLQYRLANICLHN